MYFLASINQPTKSVHLLQAMQLDSYLKELVEMKHIHSYYCPNKQSKVHPGQLLEFQCLHIEEVSQRCSYGLLPERFDHVLKNLDDLL